MERLRIEVAYAGPEGQWLVPLALEPGATALAAVLASGIAEKVAGLVPAEARLGVFSKPVAHDAPLRDGDRVEIYRPLVRDPKTARRARAGRRR